MCYMCKFTGLKFEINVFLFYQNVPFSKIFLMDPKIKFKPGANTEEITMTGFAWIKVLFKESFANWK